MKCLYCHHELDLYLPLSDIFSFSRLENKQVCSACCEAWEPVDQDNACSFCGRKGETEICLDCQNWQKQEADLFGPHQALYYYNDWMKDFLHRYKILGDYALAQIFAEDLKKALKPYHKDYLFTYVPSAEKITTERSFMPAEGLLVATGYPYKTLLKKRADKKQSRLKKADRLKISSDFELLQQHEILQSKKLLILDDIYTTGATFYQVKRILHHAGATDIKTISLLRA